MKLIQNALLLTSLMLVFFAASAQPGGRGPQMTPEERAARQTARMIGELDLNAEQSAKVEEINLRYALAQSKLREQSAGDWEAMRSSMMQLNTQKEEEFKAFLTEAQFVRYQEIQAEQRQRMQGAGQGGGRPRP